MQRLLSRHRLQIPSFRAAIFALGLITMLGSFQHNSKAQPVTEPAAVAKFPQAIQFQPKSDNPHPEKTETSGVRNGSLCAQAPPSASESEDQKLRVVAPAGALKLTASARPIFWVTIPKTQAKQLILSIEKVDDSKTPSRVFHAQQTYSISQSPVLMGLAMPKNAPDLELNTLYQWRVQLLCAEEPTPNNPFIFSSIQRVESTVPSPSEPLTKQDAIQLSQNGFWYDPVTILLNAHQTDPNDSEVPSLWQTLLESANLDAIAQTYGPNRSYIQFP